MDMNTIKVGFGRADITPVEPVPLAGYGNTSMRFHKTVRDRIYATCVAISDAADSTVLVFNLDLSIIHDAQTASARKALGEKLGIAPDRVLLNCSHTHSAPDVGNTDEPSILRYNEMLTQKIVEAAAQALEDRKPARMLCGSVEVYNMNFVKHYFHVTESGEKVYFGDCFGTPVYDETTGHATDSDPSLHLVQFQREGGKDIVMANWRAHPHFTSGAKKYDLSADYMGAYRDALEKMRDCYSIFLQGCGGNNNSSTRLPAERRFTTCDSYGMALAAAAVEGLEKYMTEVTPGPIKTKQVILPGKTDHSKDYLVPVAEKVRKVWMETYDYAQVKKVAEGTPIRSPYHANAIIGKSKRPLDMDIELNAFCIGDEVGFVTGSEMFDTISMLTEEGSPFAHTITLGYTNAYRGYIPSKFGFEYSCYESDVAWFAPGIGEQIADNFIAMLKELKD